VEEADRVWDEVAGRGWAEAVVIGPVLDREAIASARNADISSHTLQDSVA